MLRNYILVVVRNMMRNKTVSLIHITGFGLGIAAFLFVAQMAIFEFSFDTFHKNGERIYKINADYGLTNGEIFKADGIEPALSPLLENSIPEIIHAARYIPQLLEEPYCVVTYIDQAGIRKSFNELNARYVDEDFLKIFQFEVVEGNKTPLQTTSGLVMTRSCAQKYFGSEDPIGKTLVVTTGSPESNKTKFSYQVETVLQDIPSNSTLQFEILLPFGSFEDNYKIDVRSNWRWHASFLTFVEVRDNGLDPTALESKIYETIPQDIRDNWLSTGVSSVRYTLQKFSDVHFDSESVGTEVHKLKVSDRSYLFIIILIGIAILVIAEMNYISLTTAKALKRVKEISIRKIVGAGRKQLAGQFLLDAWLNVLIGIIFALTLLQVTKPLLAQWLGVSVPNVSDMNFQSILFALVFIASVVLMGFVPAYFLSATLPVSSLKGRVIQTPGGGLLRKCLVVFQFTASVSLICVTYIIVAQLTYMRSKDTGISMDQSIAIPALGTEDFELQKFRQFKDRILRDPNILSVSAGTDIPGYFLGHSPPWSSSNKPAESDFIRGAHVAVDFDYMKTLNIPLIAGREFTLDRLTDERVGLINETAVKEIGFGTADEAIGKSLFFHWLDEKREVKIIGVVSDVNFISPGSPIPATIFSFANTAHPFPRYRHYIVRAAPQQFKVSIEGVKKVWQEIFPNAPFDYFFVAEGYQQVFEQEEKMQAIATLSTVLAVFIACMGLGGLVAYSVSQRTKEIGIRKTLGASISRILYLLSHDFIRLILIAILFAIPIVWYGVTEFLKKYDYRIELSIWMFIVPCLLLVGIAIATISFQTIKAASANPVNALKYE